jgi:hypothetical protein
VRSPNQNLMRGFRGVAIVGARHAPTLLPDSPKAKSVGVEDLLFQTNGLPN